MPGDIEASRRLSLTGSKLLAVEGQDEVNFFDALLTDMGIRDVQVWPVGGKDRFRAQFPALVLAPGFEAIRVYAIIRDADTSASKTFESVVHLLRKNNQPTPRKSGGFAQVSKGRRVGVFVLPGCSEQGMLEDLCLRTVSAHSARPCVEQFMACLKKALPAKPAGARDKASAGYFPKCEPKARARAFLAAMYEDAPSVGVAAKMGCWGLKHEALADLRRFLGEFR